MQANCISFGRVKAKDVLAEFTGGRITSDAGILLLRQVNERSCFLQNLASVIHDDRDQSYVDHSYASMIQQRVFGICCGYEDGNDHAEIRKDPMFITAVGMDPATHLLASPPTLCRLENNPTRKDLVAMAKVFVEHFISSFKTPPKDLILDFDATDDRIHGEQKNAFFNGYYDSYCFLPLYVFCNDQLLLSYLRPSNIDGAKHSWAVLALLVKRFRETWPDVKIRFRADSGFCRRKMLTWCEKNNVEYIVGLAKNSLLYKAALPVIEEMQKEYKETGAKVRVLGETRYGAKSWCRERRIIVKAEQLVKAKPIANVEPEIVDKENIRFVVTNIENETPKEIYDDCYVGRGEMENRIKEQQLSLFADRTSCTEFLANQFRLFLSSAAYVLMEEIRRLALVGTELAQAQCDTIRNKLLKIGAVVIYNTRRITIKMSEYYPYQKIFRLAVQRLN